MRLTKEIKRLTNWVTPHIDVRRVSLSLRINTHFLPFNTAHRPCSCTRVAWYIERVRQSTWESRYRYGGSESGASCRKVRPLKVAAMLAPILVCVEQHLEWATPVHQPAWVYCVSAPALSAHCCFWPAALNQTPAPAPAPAHQHYSACNRPPRHASAPTRHNKRPDCDGRNPQPQHRRAVYAIDHRLTTTNVQCVLR